MIKTFQILFCLISLASYAQPDNTAISVEDSLRSELKRMTFNFNLARDEADRLAHLLVAKEMAVRSLEIKDLEFQVLLARQAFNFNKANKGNSRDIDIYRALYTALARLSDPMIKSLTPDIDKSDKLFADKVQSMADKLCFYIKRRMTSDEWDMFASGLMYEQPCQTIK